MELFCGLSGNMNNVLGEVTDGICAFYIANFKIIFTWTKGIR